MAGDVRTQTAEAASGREAARPGLPAAASRAERARRTVYRGRFMLIYVVLAALAGASVGATIVLLQRDSAAPAPPWSEWQPEGSAERRAAQIADHVGSRYRLPNGNQLVSAIAGPPSAPAADGTLVRMRAILVRPQTSRGQQEASDVDVFDAGGSVMFVLCNGSGRTCSIPPQQATTDYGALVRREALELALFTFKYVDDIDSVVLLLPTPTGQQVSNAIFLERSDVGRELSRPFADTLATEPPALGAIPADELRTVDRLTRARLYTYQYDSAQDGSPIMVLTPALG